MWGQIFVVEEPDESQDRYLPEVPFPGALGDRRGMEIIPLWVSKGIDLPH